MNHLGKLFGNLTMTYFVKVKIDFIPTLPYLAFHSLAAVHFCSYNLLQVICPLYTFEREHYEYKCKDLVILT